MHGQGDMAKHSTDNLRRVLCRSGLAVDNDIYTGPEGELVYVTDFDQVYVHDGITAGGFRVGGKFRGALVYEAADTTGLDLTSGANMTWDSEVYDTDNIHSTSTNTERLTVPAGVTHIRLTAVIYITSLTVDKFVASMFNKNGVGSFIGTANIQTEMSEAQAQHTISSPVLAVVPDDYFAVNVFVEDDTSVTLNASRSSFAMEIVN